MKPFLKIHDPVPFTQEGYEKVKQDLEMYTLKRKTAVINLRTAREMGDLSENAAYKAARFELGNIDRQIRQLRYLVRFGVITKESKKDTVSFGSKVTLDNDNKRISFYLVGAHESDPAANKLSVSSPIGAALLNKKIGDTVCVRAPNGNTNYTIVSVG